MPRTPFICGNWKMFTTAATGRELATAIARGVEDDRVRVAVCPPYTYLPTIAEALLYIPTLDDQLYAPVLSSFLAGLTIVLLADGGQYATTVPREELVGWQRGYNELGQWDVLNASMLQTTVKRNADEQDFVVLGGVFLSQNYFQKLLGKARPKDQNQRLRQF